VADKKVAQEIANVIIFCELLKQLIHRESDIFFRRNWELDGVPFITTWSAGHFLQQLDARAEEVVYTSIYLHTYISAHLYISISLYISLYLYVSIYISIHLYIYIDNGKLLHQQPRFNEVIRRQDSRTEGRTQRRKEGREDWLKEGLYEGRTL
jgi:hypothetical protein